MPYVLTVDQIESREAGDLVDRALEQLADVSTVLPFTRTVGDEFQGLLDDPVSVVTAILTLMRSAQWHIGLGIGSVERPFTSPDPRSARGDAFLAARAAVERAKSEPTHLAFATVGAGAAETADVEAVFRLLATVRSKRTEQGWQVTDLLQSGLTQQEAGRQLQISRQAVSQRAQAANVRIEYETTPILERLLERAERASTTGSAP